MRKYYERIRAFFDGPMRVYLVGFTDGLLVALVLLLFFYLAPRASGSDVVVVWDSVAGGVTYEVGVQPGHRFEAIDVFDAGEATVFTVPGLDDGRRYWLGVRSRQGGEVSGWSTLMEYTPPGEYAPPGTDLEPPQPHVRTLVKLTPVVEISKDGGPWVEEDLVPSYVEADETSEFFDCLRIDKTVVPAP